MKTASISILEGRKVTLVLTFTWSKDHTNGSLSYAGPLAQKAQELAPRAIVYTPSDGSAYRPNSWAWVAAFASFLISGQDRLGNRLLVKNAPVIRRAKPLPLDSIA